MKQKVLKELAKMDFRVVAYHMKRYTRLEELVERLSCVYAADDVTSGKMTAELVSVYESDNNTTI